MIYIYIRQVALLAKFRFEKLLFEAHYVRAAAKKLIFSVSDERPLATLRRI